MDSGQDLPGAGWVLMLVSYTITHSVYAELMLRKVQKIESDGESRPHWAYPFCVHLLCCFSFLQMGVLDVAIQVSKRRYLTNGKGVVLNRGQRFVVMSA